MKVIFLKDVPKIGKKHEVKEVADGFAYNNLIPRKLAVPATPEHMRKAEAARASVVHSKEVKETTLRELAAKSKESPLVVEVAGNEQGHLFKGLRAADIVNAIKEQHGVVVDEKDVVLSAPIKEVGAHDIVLRAAGLEVSCAFMIQAKKK